MDLGASSARIALGTLEGDTVTHHTVRQVEHSPVGRDWDLRLLVEVCRSAWGLAESEGASLGIDTWGVDHGILLEDGDVLGPVCYRDASHARAHARLASRHSELFHLTGVAAQPFNTVFQLAARAEEDPSLPEHSEWLLLPDLLAHLLGAQRSYEATIASTTQLVGLDGKWCPEAFAMCGWPVPTQDPWLGGIEDLAGVPLVRVAGHDTASAVLGLGPFAPDEAFANLGTWTLVGKLVPRPVVSEDTRELGWTNELGADGNTRLTKNVPGFYIANRVHSELFSDMDLPAWLAGAAEGAVFDVHDPRLFSPRSMSEAVVEVLGARPASHVEWAGSLVRSHVSAIQSALSELSLLCGQEIGGIAVGGGGVRCAPFVTQLGGLGRLRIGAEEATVLGNLLAQFTARGAAHA